MGRPRRSAFLPPEVASVPSSPVQSFLWQYRPLSIAVIWTGLLCGPGLITGTAVEAGPPVTATLLDGTTRAGDLSELGSDGIKIVVEGETQSLPADQLMLVDLVAPAQEESGISLSLVDDSQILASSFTSDGTTATIETADLGPLTLPVRQIRDVRLAALDPVLVAAWQDLQTRNARDDLLVFRKGDVLDYTAGSVGKITAEQITMLVRDRELSAPRERVFGIVFASRTVPQRTRAVRLQTVSGHQLKTESFALKGETLAVNTASLGDLLLPLSSLRQVDFGGGRLRSLADLTFDESESRPPDADSPVVWFVSRNAPAGSGGKSPLIIGRQEFRRGLWLHSGAVLRFRLNREFTQLRATAGFELTHATRMPGFDPRVRLVVLGDQRELYSKEFRWNDEPVPLEVDLTDVREMIIRLESLGAAKGVLEHFALGDAQVIQ